MLKLNGQEVKITRFPDNTFKFDLENNIKKENELSWYFESMEDLFTIMGIMDKLKGTKVNLFMPYIPNARMDKIQNEQEGFMLKYLVETLDNLGFQKITILDPHSDVYKQFVKNTEWIQDEDLLKKLITCAINISKMASNKDELTLVFPDKGARNRYTKLMGDSFDGPIVYGEKVRNQATGEIISFDLIGEIPDHPVLIVDDICSKGGTFYYTAKKLREKGFKGNIDLYITHAENAILEGNILEPYSDINKVYSTDSILTECVEEIITFVL